jgi:hypothetical protein
MYVETRTCFLGEVYFFSISSSKLFFREYNSTFIYDFALNLTRGMKSKIDTMILEVVGMFGTHINIYCLDI